MHLYVHIYIQTYVYINISILYILVFEHFPACLLHFNFFKKMFTLKRKTKPQIRNENIAIILEVPLAPFHFTSLSPEITTAIMLVIIIPLLLLISFTTYICIHLKKKKIILVCLVCSFYRYIHVVCVLECFPIIEIVPC